ncbi:MAG: N-acetylmuramoyl-L-alanine amidase [Clostridia bacterium]|nr:N-acetylmuramoyl-L-alanine amidase [Clostridia bacterium]
MSTVKIALDAGHGLYTVGKQTPDGIKEWIINDKVRDKVVAFLATYDCEIIHTDNDEGNTDESLTSRLNKYIAAGVAAFVSLHHNAFTGKWNGATGVEVYTDNNPTVADTQLATLIHSKMVEYTGLRGRGVKRAAFTVINQNKIPAVLCEGGFMDGTEDYKVITSDAGQTAYAKAVAESLIEFLKLEKKAQPVVEKKDEKISVTYQVWAQPKYKWLPNVVDLTDYAGLFGYDVCAVFANLSKGNIFYKVHTKDGKWLPEVKNREDYAGLLGKAIDGLMMRTDTGRTIKYAVHLRKSKRWLPFVTGYNTADSNNGYAGILGQEIDAIKIYIE